MWMIRSCISGQVFKGNASTRKSFPASSSLHLSQAALRTPSLTVPWETRAGNKNLGSFLFVTAPQIHLLTTGICCCRIRSPFVSLGTLGSGKTKGHTSVSLKCLLSLQLTHTLCKALNGASSHEWGSYHTYFNTALLLSSLVINGAKEVLCSSALETPC